MKTNTTKRIRIFSLPTYVNQSLLYLILLISIIFWGFDNKSTDEVLEDTALTQTDVHVAFAGGGWRAHTGHSAWIISLLDNNSSNTLTTLEDIFTNVNTISSNSGGSWFSTMLMYSDKFVEDIQARNAIETWDNTGWIGLQKQHFDNATYKDFFGYTYPCSHHLSSNPDKIEEGEYIDCVSDYYAESAFYWKKIIEKLVFKDYPLKSMKLSDPKQPWATDKSLLIASSLLNNSVILNKKWCRYRYYQTCLQNSTNPSNALELIDGTVGCSVGLPKDVAAVTFSSLADNSKLTPLAFLRELGTDDSQYNIGYISGSNFKGNTIQLPLDYSNVPVMTAAAASSAAAGFAASEHFTGSFLASYIAEDEALSFQLKNSKVAFADAEKMSFEDLANNKIVRLADGGPVDNSGVAQIVSFLQKNKQADSFNIVAFDNVTSFYSPKGEGARVGIDIGSLFGAPDPFGESDFKIKTPQLQIFAADSMTNTTATWSFPAKNGQQVIYTKYNVKTIENKALGIDSGSMGTLHAFTFSSSSADILPEKGDIDFKAYSDMIKYINESLNSKNSEGKREGLNYLRQAFGLPVVD